MNTKSKKSKLLIFLTLSMVGVHTAHAEPSSAPLKPVLRRTEVRIEDVFIPQTGYDDNDRIEFTVDGYLPNACYRIADTQVQKTAQPNTFIIRQFANRETDGVCADPSKLPIQMQSMVPYKLDVPIGQLNRGNYTLEFDLQSTTRTTSFTVSQAKSPRIDDYPYAAVSSVDIPDIVSGNTDVTATLRGTLMSTCYYIANVQVKPEPLNHTIVVIPMLGYREHFMCAQIVLPFETTVRLGQLSQGRYLLHVRSMNGKAVTRVFSVTHPDPESP